ncbi:uncharacterized protein LOC131328293 [Rhododendron vialii]|uniref:uncharacterized protein LOC131328293 n=1 Tax=Rhododendron vialii TaxID=182163 RepID=UPI00265DC765|nr:uncharacterized protein LOC131328293 [Rhododendron vialii]
MRAHKGAWAAVEALVWKIWRCRNDLVFNDKTWRPDMACNEAMRDASDFLATNGRLEGSKNDQISQPPGSQLTWQQLESGWIKINFDGGVDVRGKKSGLGLVARDENGAFRATRAVNIGNLVHPLVAEGMPAAREGLLFTQELGFTRIQLEGDSQQIVNLIQRKGIYCCVFRVL